MPDKIMADRDQKIVSLYGSGVPGTEIAERFGITRQRVEQILKRDGAVNAAQARVARATERRGLQESHVDQFLENYGRQLKELVEKRATRAEVDGKFALLEPNIARETINDAIKKLGLIFDVNREELNFSATVVEAGLWYVMARVNSIESDPSIAIEEVSLKEMLDIAELSNSEGIDSATVRSIIASVGSCRRALIMDPRLTITSKRYDQERSEVINDFRIDSMQRLTGWPPTSQTVKRRLGGGYWRDALSAVGIIASERGRTRGLLIFEESDYVDAVQEFAQHCRNTRTPTSYKSYETWVSQEERAGRQRPSGPSLRNFFGS